jgi:dolichol-phosphate mannosyltransferase
MSLPANPSTVVGREREIASSATTPRTTSKAGPELTIVVPTLNERDNVGPLIDRLDRILGGVDWEAVFVDDDSADETAEHLRDLGRTDRRIRCIRRFGRRGLSSACIEGILSTSARYIAVIDADLQHDEALLPRMLEILKRGQTDLVVASRYLASGAADGLSTKRRRVLSRAGVRLARVLLKSDITDPVSGFFMMRSEVADKAAARLSGVGTKILIDILASAPGPLSVTELPYRFRGRNSGSSKLDWFTVLEFLALLVEKVSGGYLPSKFLLFGTVGASGMVLHLVVLRLLLAAGAGFVWAQSTATATAMVWNYFLNNTFTYRDSRLVGWAALRGLASFMLICGLGAVVNVLVARDLYVMTQMWLFAGVGGALVGALLNYSLTSMFTWGRHLS